MLDMVRPVNRYITIVPSIEKKKQETGVLLPDGYEEEKRFIVATVVDVSADCAPALVKMKHRYPNTSIIVDKSMIEEIEIKNKKFHMILENYVMGIIKGPPV